MVLDEREGDRSSDYSKVLAGKALPTIPIFRHNMEEEGKAPELMLMRAARHRNALLRIAQQEAWLGRSC